MDIFVSILCTFILIVNVAGTLYDVYATKESKSKAVNMIVAFSLLRNWPKLFQADYRSRAPLDRLKGLDGVRAVLMILLVTGHFFIPYTMAISNPHFIEEVYHFLPYHVFINGAAIVQTFFLMSGLLLSYSLQRTAEKKTIKWTMLTNNIWKRWLRLTPSFAVVLAFTSTLLRFISSGPLVQVILTRMGNFNHWFIDCLNCSRLYNTGTNLRKTDLRTLVIGSKLLDFQLLDWTEIEDCRRSWMWNFFYLRNYKFDSQCMPQTWYLAADLHLYCVGLAIFVLIRNSYWRNIVLAMFFAVGVVVTGLVIYFNDLTFLMTISPRMLMQLFIEDTAYNYLYMASHTNIPSFAIGLALGALIHNLQKKDFNLDKYKVPVLGMVTISFIAGTIIWLVIDAPVNQLVKIWLETPAKKHNKVKKNDNIDVIVEKL
ncbi:PREDICTED: nose resistant to fluoxetine protein 6-like [Papilio polytes]|uniref:nose resistant to fluoxetine protein 6-like n=1 Tax=Papilio polytes TaxID=76194 RepID=UPI0006762EBE|nr:PREDICTED: nose resistant to fluoxetine protein 6-like [Papilio polytes]